MPRGKEADTLGLGGEPIDLPGENPNGSGSAAGGNGGGKLGPGNSVAGDNQQAKGAGAPSSAAVAGLFHPSTSTTANSQPTGSSAHSDRSSSGGGPAKKLADSGKVPDLDDIGAIADPVEREAAQKLQRAVQRIKANRDRRANPLRGGPGSAPYGTRRDW